MADAQQFEQRRPRIIRITLRADDIFQRRREQVAVAAGITEGLPRFGVSIVIGGERGHVAMAPGVEHRHHRGFQWRVFVVFLPVDTGSPVQQVGDFDGRVLFQRRVKLHDRGFKFEQAFAIRHTEDGGHQTFAD
ncbi:hypothetical protein D3C78_1316200 [compost metagenome]